MPSGPPKVAMSSVAVDCQEWRYENFIHKNGRWDGKLAHKTCRESQKFAHKNGGLEGKIAHKIC